MILAAAASLALSLAPVAPPTTQTAPAAAPASAASGLPIAAMTAFLTAQGLTVGPVQQEGERRFVSVTDGPLRWVLFFQACEGEVCSDLQYSFAFSNAGVTLDGVNRWNRERRFLKAFYEPAATPAAAVQYDVLLNAAQGVEQLADPLIVWRGSIAEFPAVVVGATAPPAPTPPPAQ